MKKFVACFIIALCSATVADAQTYLDHLKQSKNGVGKVVVTQSKEIDDIVNGKKQVRQSAATPTKPAGTASATPRSQQDGVKSRETTGKEKLKETDGDSANVHEAEKAEEARRAAEARRRAENKSREAEKNQADEEEMNIPTVDMRKKVMRGSRKVTGYRVQAYAGGNTRNDRQRAQQIGNAIKMKFPDQPVYVHFYSPRWICRVGNFRSYQEAQRLLRQVKAMGYSAATIVSGKITVQY
ncbi:MAG: SPOR domain-containing protein [Prevotella sp.]|nr:SPOR domain-containing protein [Prevotella sp.]